MSTVGTRKRGPGPCHFLPRVREAACEHYYIAYLRGTGISLDNKDLPKRGRGCKGDPFIRDAWESFYATHTRNGWLIAQQRHITKEGFHKILIKHFASWSATRKCPSGSRKKAVNLTDAELQELADLLVTPVQHDDNYIRFDSITQAAEYVDRVKQLY